MLLSMVDDKRPTIKEIYPDLTDEELEQAEANFDAYLQLLLQIFERIEQESASNATLKELAKRRRHKEK